MIECQFCPAKGPARGWVKVDEDLYICPSCIPPVEPDLPTPTQEEKEEIQRSKDDYLKRFYSE